MQIYVLLHNGIPQRIPQRMVLAIELETRRRVRSAAQLHFISQDIPFETLEKEIADLEKEKSNINEKLNDASIHFNQLQELSLRIGEINLLLEEKETRWLTLSE